ncbi:MAG: ParB N-terminal domain-containing protein [Anaerolineae bacterium]|nr:ParB N-terminal domain-containing protein [Anaerolineae bacterium]
MWTWLKNLLSDDGRVKSFEEEIAAYPEVTYEKRGLMSIPLQHIVGSVGRAHELNKSFHYRKRSNTQRYVAVNEAMRIGRPSDPIQVVKIKRDRADSEYYVIDGHHRVATAIEEGFESINAFVTEVIVPENDAETH